MSGNGKNFPFLSNPFLFEMMEIIGPSSKWNSLFFKYKIVLKYLQKYLWFNYDEIEKYRR